MPTWTSDEINRISTADELEVAPLGGDGARLRPVPIWVVRHDDGLYVRSYKGTDGRWYRAALTSSQGRIQAGGVDRDVTFVAETDPELNEQIDAAYRSKYHRYGQNYVEAMVSSDARTTTLRLLPR
ncbi:hypothetical protein SAMN05421874_12083 [Nonomuraea maritima]|uniref:DUF2255 family protein n=1 Tax=Nonomuraea maritima TaxID=683260 RepID=A0A1G9JK36_9ACTN|nr:DUF2255 family protein [Nonomuraea maritima]SDL37453.1 hypothetical protein SAMN05421874_12083 [Nonomuraea maritima]